jgi:peptide/nickel transport system substrate-binding protein
MSAENRDRRQTVLVWDRMPATSRRRFMRTAMRLGLGAVAAPALVEALAACGQLGVGNSTSTKTLTWSRGDDLRSQDPQANTGLMEGTIAAVLYDGLVDTDPKGAIIPALATEWSMAADGLSYVFKLRPGVKFHDGSDFNADAVVWSFTRLMSDPAFAASSPFVGFLKQTVAVDLMSVRFDLQKPNPGLITSFTTPILSAAAKQKFGDQFFKQVGGTGPFKFKSYTPNDRWVGDANREYWQAGAVKLDQYVFRSIQEEATRIAAIQTGELDVIDNLSGDQAEQLAKDPNIQVIRSPGSTNIEVTFNVRRDPFKNKDARWAAASAIDRANIVQNLTKSGTVVGASIPPSTPGYSQELWTKISPYDMARAKQLFASAGLQPGTPLSFKMNPAWFPKLKETGEYIAAQLNELGFKTTLQFLEPAAYTDARKSGEFDMCIQEVGRAFNPGPNFTTIFIDQALGNFYKDVNPNIATMITAASAELDATKRDDAYKKIDALIADDLPEFPLYQRELIWGVRKRVQNFQGRVGGDTRVQACDVSA